MRFPIHPNVLLNIAIGLSLAKSELANIILIRNYFIIFWIALQDENTKYIGGFARS